MKKGLLFVVVSAVIMMLVYSLVVAAEKKVEGQVVGKVVCSVEWKEKAATYQGTNVICHDPKHERMLVTEKGEEYRLEPAAGAGEKVKKLIHSKAYEKKEVTVEGEIEKGITNVIKVKSFKVKE